MSETKPKERAPPKTKEERRAGWRRYYSKNKEKYLAWARGWRSDLGVTFEAFNKRWKADHKKAEKKAPQKKAEK